jgi:hypothetical protein
MRDRFIGAIGVLWGGFLLVRAYLQYARGVVAPASIAQILSLVFAVLFVLGGLYYLFKPRVKADTNA